MSKHIADRDAGRRAAQLIYETAGTAHGALSAQLKRLGLKRSTFHGWASGNSVPGLYALQTMAACGYDVAYILIGRRSTPDQVLQPGGDKPG